MTSLATVASLTGNLLNAALNADKFFFQNDDIFNRLLIANDRQTALLLESITADNLKFSRKTGSNFTILTASYTCPQSVYYHQPLLISKLKLLTNFLLSHQTSDGTVNIANLESPPDTAFLLEYLTVAALLLLKDQSPDLTEINSTLKNFLLKAGDALTTGGVHTPNHRWVICAALARLHTIYPNKKYISRIEEWLGEGIFMDKEGHYPERSSIYSNVENNSLLTIGRLLKKPALFEYVRRNLNTTYFYMQPNGDLITTASRRQDQYSSLNIVIYYLHYRYLAIKDHNAHFAAIAKFIEGMNNFEAAILQKDFFHFLENPLLQNNLPAPAPLPVNYKKLFTTTQLLHIRNGNKDTTLFGGADQPLLIASGRSNSPNFFSYRNGNAILEYVRLSTAFFGMGYFYSDGIKKEGNTYVLQQKLTVPYYQPLPKNFRKADGDYTLSPSTDNRFWNKMDFSNRPLSNIKMLNITINFFESDDGNVLDFVVTGLAGVAVTIEFCFQEGGTLSGVVKNEEHYLPEGSTGKYEFKNDVIYFGPGSMEHQSVSNLDGERYSTHFGTLKTEGVHAYITGITPFKHQLIIR